MQEAYPSVKLAWALASLLVLSSIVYAPTGLRAEEGPQKGSASDDRRAEAAETPSPAAETAGTFGLEYTPGRGLRVGNTGIVLGGYSSVEVNRDEGEPVEFLFEDLSFFVIFQPLGRFSFFSELEFEDLFSIDSDGDAGSPDGRFEIERLYGDFRFDDRLELRAGKFLTPVGRWNVIHAQPLVWTTSRPLVTEAPFDENTTGLMLRGSVARGKVTYRLWGQFTNQLEPSPQIVQSDRSGGARMQLDLLPTLSIGGSYLSFRSQGEWFHLVGADALWRSGRIEWMSEASFDTGAGSSGSQWGLYSQIAVRAIGRVYAVGRYELFSPRGSRRRLNQVILAAAYRPRPFAIFKIEYQLADRSSDLSEPGFRSSFALLF